MSDPRTTFDRAAAAVKRSDWRAVAELCDQRSLEDFKLQQLEIYGPAGDVTARSPEQYMERVPGMPFELAEYLVEKSRRSADRAARLGADLPGISTVEGLSSTPAADVLAAWLRGRSPAHQFERLLREGHLKGPGGDDVRITERVELLLQSVGSVQEGERTAYVLFRLEFGDPEEGGSSAAVEASAGEHPTPPPPSMATLRRDEEGEWRLLVDENFLGLGEMFVGFGLADDGLSSSS